MAGYNCTIEYIAGTTNICADLLSRKPDDANKCQEHLTDEVDLDVNDNTFEVDVKDSNQFEQKEFENCEILFENFLVKSDECLPGLNMDNEKNKDGEIVEFKTILVHDEPRKEVQRRFLVIDGVHYFLTDLDGDTVFCQEVSGGRRRFRR